MIRTFFQVCSLIAALVLGLGLLIGAVALLARNGLPVSMLFLAQILIFLAWWSYTYAYYRSLRRDELHQVIVSAIDTEMPIVPVLRAYLNDRPQEEPFTWALMVLTVILCPLGIGIIIWLRIRRFDRRVEDLITLIEEGVPLSRAVGLVPGVASWETQLALLMRERTGKEKRTPALGDRDAYQIPWLELAPRFMYIPAVFLFFLFIASFCTVMIIPKFKKIFEDFGIPLPWTTRAFFSFAVWCFSYIYIPILLIIALVFLGAYAIVSPTVRWHVPVIGRFYRRQMQGRVLRMLGISIKTGMTIPDALSLMADCGVFPDPIRLRLRQTFESVNRGEPIEKALQQASLLPKSIVPLVEASAKLKTLPETLVELGDHLAGSSIRQAKRLTLLITPLLLLIMGGLVGLFAVSMFLPLIEILNGLGGP